MKKTFLLFFVFLLIIQPSLGIICEERTSPADIPCTVVTPVISCDNYTYNILNVSDNGTVITTGNLTPIGNDIYEFNFTYTTGEYQIKLCSYHSSSVNISFDPGENFTWLYIIGFTLFLTFIFVAWKTEQEIFAVISGMLLNVIAIFIFSYGVPGYNNDFLLNSIVIVLVGVGFYLIIVPFVSLFEGGFG